MSAVADRVRAAGLDVMGGFHPEPSDGLEGVGTLVLLGPSEPGFWEVVSAAPEFADGAPDPLDRWSARVIGGLARDLGARAFFPFGMPRQPFIGWALRSGRAWISEVGLLIHDVAGLLVSFRGALGLPERIALASGTRPCDACGPKPCRTACPVGALTLAGYDIPACKAYLATPEGATGCMAAGCAVRTACPVSRGHPRHPALSAHHMRSFA